MKNTLTTEQAKDKALKLLKDVHDTALEVSKFVNNPNYPCKENLQYAVRKIEESELFDIEEKTRRVFGRERTSIKLIPRNTNHCLNQFEIQSKVRSKLDDYVATDGVIELTGVSLDTIVDDLMNIFVEGLSDTVNSLPICECSSWAHDGVTIDELKENPHHKNCKQRKWQIPHHPTKG